MISELDAVVNVLGNKLSSIYKTNKSSQTILGDVGECFAKTGVKQSFFDRGYILYKYGKRTFRVYKQINPTGKGRGGIDFNIDFTDSKGNVYECFTEMKNWNHYHKGIPPHMYNTEIKNRFTKNDPNKDRYWILIINKVNIQYIKNNCISDKINIVPIDDQIDQNYIYKPLLKPTLLHFIGDFNTLINDILSAKIKK